MSTTISILGGAGLFLLGMTVMTEGLKPLADRSAARKKRRAT
jgi:phosphate:Na+ symporter